MSRLVFIRKSLAELYVSRACNSSRPAPPPPPAPIRGVDAARDPPGRNAEADSLISPIIYVCLVRLSFAWDRRCSQRRGDRHTLNAKKLKGVSLHRKLCCRPAPKSESIRRTEPHLRHNVTWIPARSTHFTHFRWIVISVLAILTSQRHVKKFSADRRAARRR